MRHNKESELLKEVKYQTSRSSGKGGQHANKTETRVELFFDIPESAVLLPEEKERLLRILGKRLSKEGILRMEAEDSRSQAQNKSLVTKRFLDLLRKALKKEKLRKKTRPPRKAAEMRLQRKKKHSEKKARRKRGRHWPE